MSASSPHSGHLDAELNQPEELATQRLVEIARECLQRWDGFPTIPGSRRWSVNGGTALRELDRRQSHLEEQLETAQEEVRHWKYDHQEASKELLARAERAEEQHEDLELRLRGALEALDFYWERFGRPAASGPSNPANRPDASESPFPKPKMQQIGESLPASEPDGAYWRAQGGVPNQETRPDCHTEASS